MKTHSIIQGATVAALLIMLVGCKEDEYSLRFSHYLHVTENEMGCDECHGEPGQPSFNTLSHDTCLDCHDEPDADKITPETCGMCHQEKQLALFSLPDVSEEESADAAVVEELPSRNVFVHTEALANQCMECHAMLMDEDLLTVPTLSRSDILSIREESHGSGQSCLNCHVDMDRLQEPASHDLIWMRRHGQFGLMDEDSCTVCHLEDSCRDCHSVMKPLDHNNFWRLRTHGVVAAWDRASCIVCHQEDFCSACHAETRPASHNARWAAPGKTPSHCIGCHTATTAGEGCVVCHEDGNDILLHQSFWPSSHNSQPVAEIGCYQCHWVNTP